jgi:hypothetical protein
MDHDNAADFSKGCMSISIFSKHVFIYPQPARPGFTASMGKKQSGSAEKKPAEKKGNTKNTDKGDQSEGKVSYNSRF